MGDAFAGAATGMDIPKRTTKISAKEILVVDLLLVTFKLDFLNRSTSLPNEKFSNQDSYNESSEYSSQC